MRRVDTWYGVADEVGNILADYNTSIVLINATSEIELKAVARCPEYAKFLDEMLSLVEEIPESLRKTKRPEYFNPFLADRLLRIATGDKTALWDS